MGKKVIEDMTTKKRREDHKKVWDEVVRNKPKTRPEITPLEYRNTPAQLKKVNGGSRYGLWVVAFLSVIFLLFSFSILSDGATLAIGPKVEELDLNQSLSSTKGGAEGVLPYELMVISGEEVKEVEGGEEKEVSRNAEGIVVIYNAYSGATQALNVDTRLEGSNGKIYKTKKSVTVPGMKGTTPGSVEVEIYASGAGESYNSSPLDFTILGFKGTSKYSKFYARSKSDIKGGFVGKEREVAEAEKNKVLDELKTRLQAKLLQKATDQIPSGFILFKNATSVSVNEEEFVSLPGGNMVEVRVGGTFHGILFEEKPLTVEIIKKKLPQEAGKDIYIPGIQDLEFSLIDTESFPGFAAAKNINFKLSGKARAVWRIDEEKLKDDIVGQKKGNLNQLLAQHPNIISADLSLRPFWKRSLPDEKKDIKIIVSYPQ